MCPHPTAIEAVEQNEQRVLSAAQGRGVIDEQNPLGGRRIFRGHGGFRRRGFPFLYDQTLADCTSEGPMAQTSPWLHTVHVYKDFPPVRGGIEGHVDLLTRLLAERGVSAEVLCASVAGAPRRERRGAVNVTRCVRMATIASSPLPPLLPWALRRSAADVVHLHYPWPPGELAYVLGGRKRHLVVTIHCEVVRHARLARWLNPLTQRILAAAGRIVVTGSFMQEADLLAPHRGRVRVVPLGVDLDYFKPEPAARDPIPQVPHPRILFVGKLRYYKGLPVLAAAMARLPEAHLVVAGEGPELPAFERALRENQCRGRSHLLGEVDGETLRRLYQTADAAVLPSTSKAEAFGIAVAEAQACGVPAVITNVGTGTAQTVNDGVSGRVIPPRDPVALATALAWCLEPGRSAALRLAARTHAERDLCARRMVATVQQLYEEVVRSSPRGGSPACA
jgi:glycosyltransferase involved in cell wall biosynthesis